VNIERVSVRSMRISHAYASGLAPAPQPFYNLGINRKGAIGDSARRPRDDRPL